MQSIVVPWLDHKYQFFQMLERYVSLQLIHIIYEFFHDDVLHFPTLSHFFASNNTITFALSHEKTLSTIYDKTEPLFRRCAVQLDAVRLRKRSLSLLPVRLQHDKWYLVQRHGTCEVTFHQIECPPSMLLHHANTICGLYVHVESDFYKFDELTRRWSKLIESPGHINHWTAAAQSDTGIFFLGGLHFPKWNGNCAKVLFYDSLSTTWKVMRSLPQTRIFCACIVFLDDLYVFGGHIEPCFNVCSTVLCLRKNTEFWITCAPMTKPRARASAFLINQMICVSGGDAIESERTYECYDPQTNTWTLPQKTSTSNTGAALSPNASCVFRNSKTF